MPLAEDRGLNLRLEQNISALPRESTMDFLGQVAAILSEAGIGISSNAAYDFLKRRFARRKTIHADELQDAIDAFLVVHGIHATASTIMELLAGRGLLQVTESRLYAPVALSISSAGGGTFVVGDNSRTSTDRTAVQAGHGAYVVGRNAEIRQGADGSISFRVGEGSGDRISFRTRRPP
jgi:hypothetical protein